MRRFAEEDKSRTSARISILESVKEQLAKSPPPNDRAPSVPSKELERLMKLANRTSAAREVDDSNNNNGNNNNGNKVLGDDVSWSDIFSGRVPKVDKDEMTRWEREDLEKRAFNLNSEQFHN